MKQESTTYSEVILESFYLGSFLSAFVGLFLVLADTLYPIYM